MKGLINMRVQPIQGIQKFYNRTKKRNDQYYYTGRKRNEPVERPDDFDWEDEEDDTEEGC